VGARPLDPPRLLLDFKDGFARGVAALAHPGVFGVAVPPSDVARFGGTSVTMLERVYAHLLETSADAARQRLDAFAEAAETEEKAL
jgi:hypothetical protein